MIPDDIIKSQIKDYWQNHRHCTHVEKHASSELVEFLEGQVQEHPWFESLFSALSFAEKGHYEPVKCKVCGKVFRIDNAREGKMYCSGKCASNDRDVREKTAMTNMERYGVCSPTQNQSVRQKQRATMKERYGAEYTLSSDALVQKQSRTLMEKYGVDKIGKSCEVREKIRATMMEKYGAEHYFETDEYKEKASLLNRKKGYAMMERWKDYVLPLFTEDEFMGMFKRSSDGVKYKWKCAKCGMEFEAVAYGSGFHKELGSGYLPRCPHCFPVAQNVSMKEKELVEYIKTICDCEIITNSMKIVDGFELDIYVPEKNIAIEFDGLHWHSESNGRGKAYHVNKTEMCEKNGIRLIHIFEDEWLYKNDIVKDRINSIFGCMKNRIYARECTIKEITAMESNGFLSKNHMQGMDRSSIRYGLFYKDELVEVMTFGHPRFNGRYDYELIRNASKIGFVVVGGASKLFHHFISLHHSCSVISYADRRYSIGTVYNKIGFRFLNYTSPNYWWCKNKHKYSRYQCQKRNLPFILGDNYDGALSENENMIRAGFEKLYDCGNIVYIYEDKEK